MAETAAPSVAAGGKMVQVFGRKRHAVGVAVVKPGKGVVRLNGQPLHLVEPAILRIKIMEPILLLGKEYFDGVDIRMRVSGGGYSSQIYAVRQALAKGIVAYYHSKYLGGKGGGELSGEELYLGAEERDDGRQPPSFSPSRVIRGHVRYRRMLN
jgi:ribosomal protein S9